VGRKLVLVGVGGIETADDAFERIAAGATLLQAYTGFVYGGPRFAARIHEGLAERLRERGIASVADLVGTDARPAHATLATGGANP
jgi:dihydroorotate dehydrogenase